MRLEGGVQEEGIERFVEDWRSTGTQHFERSAVKHSLIEQCVTHMDIICVLSRQSPNNR